MLLSIGVEPAEDIRGGRFFEFNGRDEAQDVVPEYRAKKISVGLYVPLLG